MNYLILGVIAFIAAFVQATMGFGAGVILVNVMPLFFPYSKAIALMQASILFLNIVFSIKYRNKIRWDVLVPALIPGTVLGLLFTFWSVTIDVAILTVALGVAFIALSIYTLALADKVHVKPSKTNGFILGSCSGLTNAFFGFAGPPVAAYFAPSLEDNLEYFVTSQFFFMCSSAACIVARFFSGIYEVSDLPMLGLLVACLGAGMLSGVGLLKKADGKVLKKLIYGFIGLNGVYIIVKELIAH